MDSISVLFLGELMLRLSPENGKRLLQFPTLEVSFGGAEANSAVLLSRLGCRTEFISAFPGNEFGEAALRELRANNVGTRFCLKKDGRMGIYFLEKGGDQRPPKVIYDRENSSASKITPGDFNWPEIFRESGAGWLYVTGITPAISSSAKETVFSALEAAKKAGLKILVDLNFRKKLWNYGEKASQVMPRIASYGDILIANEEDIQKSLEITTDRTGEVSSSLDETGYVELIKKTREQYPGAELIAITMRESFSADRNRWSAVVSAGKELIVSRKHVMEDITDRIGAGDAFAAALLYAYCTMDDIKEIVEFSVAAAVLKHSVWGDFPLISLEEIKALAKGNESGRVQR